MEITEVRVKLMELSEDRLRGFCSITFDHCFVVRDLKIIDGTSGPFVAMPSRKLTSHCPRCSHKNHLRAVYCNQCGVKLRGQQDADFDSPQKLYADIAHPINSECRETIQQAVIAEFEAELRRAAEPGYQPRYEEDFEHEEASLSQPGEPPKQSPPKPHFESRPPTESTRADEDEQQGGFGAGIF